MTDVNVEAIAAQVGEVIFFGEEDHIGLYSSIMKGVGERPAHEPAAGNHPPNPWP